MVIIGLSCVPAPFDGRPTVRGWKLVLPAAMRFTTMRLCAAPSRLRPPNHRSPASPAANIGSQQMSELSGTPPPGASVVGGITRPVKLAPPSWVT
jgi:hypothetical protein